MAGTTIPNVPPQFLDNNGDPASGYQLFTYSAGTSTKLATYSDVDLSSANANPIVLDSAGRATIFLTAASYKFVLATDTDTDPPASPIWTRDNVSANAPFSANPTVTGTAGEAISEGEAVYCSKGDGGLTTGSWYLADADNDYSADEAVVIGIADEDIASASSGSIIVGGRVTGFSGLSTGSVYYISSTAGALTATKPALNDRAVGIADSATSLVLAPIDGENERVTDLLQIYEHSQLSDTGNVGTGEDTLYSHNLSAGQVATNNDCIRIVAWGKTANNAATKDIQIRIDDTSTDTSILDASLTTDEAGHWLAGAIVTRVSSTTARSAAQVTCGASNTAVSGCFGNIGKDFSCTWANAVEIRITGEATTTDDITIEGAYVTLVLT